MIWIRENSEEKRKIDFRGESMVVEQIAVGDELLLGNIVNTNGSFLAEEFSKLGFESFFQSVVGDNKDNICMLLDSAKGRADIVVLTGGMGPTKDDITKEVLSSYLNIPLTEDALAKEKLVSLFSARGKEITENSFKQAWVIKGSKVLYNDFGHSCGEIVETEDCKYILLPGQPNELMPMFKERVIPYLKEISDSTIVSKNVKISGITEAELENRVKDIIKKYKNPKVSLHAKVGEVHIHVVAKASDEKECDKLIKPVVKDLKTAVGEYIFTTKDDVTLEESLAELLLANKLTVSTAESCTGGIIASRIINVPGASDILKASYVTYSDKAKHKILGVKNSTLQKYTAVSEEVCREMAEAENLQIKSDVVISVTGLAGPDGGTKEKPVGLVYIGCNVKGKVSVYEYRFKGDRQKIRDCAATAALSVARMNILKYISETEFGIK